MAEKLYGLTERTAGALKQLLGDGGAIGGRASSGAAARGVTWVLCTGPAVDGWYPGLVSIDVDGEWEDLTAPVKVAPAGDAELEEDVRYLCTRTGDDDDGARFRAVAGRGGDGGGGVGGSGALCAWMKALLEGDCFELTFGDEDPVLLPGTVTIGGEEYEASFDPLTQTLTIGEQVGVLSACDCPCMWFVFLRTDFLLDDEPAPSVCDRQFEVKVCQTCCPIDGWDGAGWYCVREAGTEDPCTPVELLEEDRCDDTLEICSGPYADEDAANEVCGPGPKVVCGPCAEVWENYTATPSGITAGDCPLCAVFNVPHTVTFGSDNGLWCEWTAPEVTLSCADGSESPRLVFQRVHSSAKWRAFFGNLNDSPMWEVAVAEGDCLTAKTLTLVNTPGTQCAGWPSTLTLSPA